jgi:TPR repeat protein
MRQFRSAAAGIVIALSTVLSPAYAQPASGGDGYAEQQALVARLSHSATYQDHRQLAELLREGLIASADNPLRRADRDGAIAAYRRAVELGDRSAGTHVALARLLLRENEAEGLADLRATLRGLVLQGNGDAAYVLALDAAQNLKSPPEEITGKLEAAAVMGSISAVIDLVGSGTVIGAAARTTSVDALQRRALSGWAPASYALYQAYFDGKLVERSPQTAMRWLTLATEQHYPAAMEQMAENLLHGNGMAADPARALDLYRSAAGLGSAASAMAIGSSPSSGPGMGVSTEEARLWLRRAAEIGFRDAAAELTNLDLRTVLDSDADPAEKARRVALALEPIAADPDALANLANRYWRTSSSTVIGPTIMALLKEHTLQGSPVAGLAYNAWLQANGQPLTRDVAHALVDGLEKQPVRSAGFSDFLVADLVLSGRISEDVVPRADALNLLVEAADAKVGQAMLRLGKLYEQGDQLARSATFAKRWLALARAQAVERAAWDLAALQVGGSDPAERGEGERFYLQRLDDGDVRAAIALARYRLQNEVLDPSTLAQILRVIRQPGDIVEFASILINSGISTHVATARELLAGLREDQLDVETLVGYSRLLVLIAATDPEAARGVGLMEKAAATGAPAARIALASTYLSSVTYRDRQEYAVSLLNEVLTDDPRNQDARLLMSKAYLVGLGTKRDGQKAADLVEAIRAEGEYRNPKATMLAADWLAFSTNTRDAAGAEAMLKAQSARGSIAADRALGDFYLSGFAPSIEPDVAASRLHDAANAGDKEAMASLGHLLLNGYGVNKSKAAGLSWLTRAAEAGHTAAMYELSRIYALAPADQTDGASIIVWLTRAANRNHPNASYQLGLAYLKGEWVAADTGQAIAWFERSAASGNLLAARTVDALRRQMSEGSSPDISEVSHE